MEKSYNAFCNLEVEHWTERDDQKLLNLGYASDTKSLLNFGYSTPEDIEQLDDLFPTRTYEMIQLRYWHLTECPQHEAYRRRNVWTEEDDKNLFEIIIGRNQDYNVLPVEEQKLFRAKIFANKSSEVLRLRRNAGETFLKITLKKKQSVDGKMLRIDENIFREAALCVRDARELSNEVLQVFIEKFWKIIGKKCSGEDVAIEGDGRLKKMKQKLQNWMVGVARGEFQYFQRVATNDNKAMWNIHLQKLQKSFLKIFHTATDSGEDEISQPIQSIEERIEALTDFNDAAYKRLRPWTEADLAKLMEWEKNGALEVRQQAVESAAKVLKKRGQAGKQNKKGVSERVSRSSIDIIYERELKAMELKKSFVVEFYRWQSDIDAQLKSNLKIQRDVDENNNSDHMKNDDDDEDDDDDCDDEGINQYAEPITKKKSFFDTILWKYLDVLRQFILVVGVGVTFLLWNERELRLQREIAKHPDDDELKSTSFGLIDACFFAVVICTTVGYGYRITPATDGCKLFLIIYMFVATTYVGHLINEVSEIYLCDIAQKRVRDVVIENTMHLYKADTSGDGSVTESDFLLFKLRELLAVDEALYKRVKDVFKNKFEREDPKGWAKVGQDVPSEYQVDLLKKCRSAMRGFVRDGGGG